MTQLDEIPGIGVIGAQELIAELGVDMTRFPTAGHLASWAKFAPIDHQSAGKGKAGATGKGNSWLAAPSVRSSPDPRAPTPSSANGIGG
jgi:transposase